jgi:hypothetical protein
MMLFSFQSEAQIRLNQNGRIGLGTTSPSWPVHVESSLTVFRWQYQGSNRALSIKPANPGPEIGSSTDQINFWYNSSVGYNKLKAQSYTCVSDSNLKENITPIDSCLSLILSLNPRSYNFILSEDSLRDKRFGFIAQQLNEIIPEVVDDKDSLMSVDYDQIIPLLTGAIQELSTKVDSLELELSSSNKFQESTKSDFGRGSYLMQNTPNPWQSTTLINYGIAESVTSAQIMIFDLNGKLQWSENLELQSDGSVQLSSGVLEPGMYIYTLVLNGYEFESKKMILTK